MDIVSIASLAGSVIIIVMLYFAGQNARTAPATFILAMFVAIGLMTFLALTGINETGANRNMLLGSTLGLIVALFISLIFAGKSAAPCQYEAHGSDLHAIRRSCEARNQANKTIMQFNTDRRNMPLLQRLRDAFVTTPEERTHGAAVTVVMAAKAHLAAIVPSWHRIRTEDLVDLDGARAGIQVIETRLRPLETIEQTAREIHQLGVNAVSALDNAIEDIRSAETYETIDAVSSNNGLSAVSTFANSKAKDSVKEARKAIDLLSHKTKTAIAEQLVVPGDMFDLILDITLDSGFDFISLLNIGKLIEARRKCEKARQQIANIEAELRTQYLTARDNAQAVRNEVAIIKQPYRERAIQELPDFARTYVPGIVAT